ncbi:protein SYS1 homolog [Rhipicephalus sanguineus]|uniref:Protein SYS1 homolog n=3 Tax=Rhipicephalus TaxID=426455 RepID=A0A131YU98_RHIAP|nr:protein SYS1 homolog [Rhipicephalus sanguineus]
MMAGHFRYSVWDPFLIISQMITLQCMYYVGLGFWICFLDIVTGQVLSLDQLFSYETVHIKDMRGRCIIGSYIINSLFASLGLWYFVQRTKQCLDFTCTVHFFHLIGCWIYNAAFPHTLSWWLLNTACVTVTCVCGEFLCIRTEMKAIPLSLSPKADL